jgi:hypothetical protein
MLIGVIFVSALVFYQLRRSSTNTLVAILVMCVLLAGLYWAHDTRRIRIEAFKKDLNEDLADRTEVISDSYEVKKSRKLKYLEENQELRAIAMNLRFVRIFDKGRFGDLLVHMDKFQKVYMYILARRYQPREYIGTFQDLRQAVLEILYSLIFVVPKRLKHTYGLDPYSEIQKSIQEFTALSRKMEDILYAFAKAEGHQLARSYYHPYDPTRTHILP